MPKYEIYHSAVPEDNDPIIRLDLSHDNGQMHVSAVSKSGTIERTILGFNTDGTLVLFEHAGVEGLKTNKNGKIRVVSYQK